ncbi:unnamed protein product, partial [Mesorhabditis belari]|uniref:Zinc transporter ZIP9 n=1 Tax=Mesorhabditis belari TaxID=2138241 RepID=A0AAF3ESR8_9BILA
MADPFTFLVVLSSAMFLGSYLAGSIPLLFTMSESKMRLLSIFGAGLLVGTALSVIIPEGVESLYAVKQDVHYEDHNVAGAAHGGINAPQVAKSILEGNKDGESPHVDSPRLIPKDVQLNDGIVGARVKRESTADHEHEEHKHSHGSNIHAQIGLSLVVGFVFMLLVDQISNMALSKNDRTGRQRIGISATIGLVVHAAADGVALGGASSINKTEVQMIVFIAIMLHKGPASFGLVSFLLMEGLDKRAVKKHLLVFSSSAPLAALFTYIIIGNAGSGISSNDPTIGILMLFSAGTFLYVATVHVLPELANQSKNTNYDLLVMDAQTPSTLRHSHSHGGVTFSIQELFYIILGAIIPAILASGHSH